VVTRILHVSDLHVGAREDPVLEGALRSLAAHCMPALIVVSGDLTHRGRPAQHQEAAALLTSLGVPLLAVPGNHDIPYTFPARFTHPWREFDRCWQTTHPVHEGDAALVVGLNSVRPWRHQSGGLSEAELTHAEERLRRAAPGVLRMVVLHHQLINAPWRTRKRPLAHRDAVLQRLVGGGAELIVGGHVHQAAVAERHEFEVARDLQGAVITTAPGLGRPRPRRHGEARGALDYRIDESTITVDTHSWLGEEWGLTATRTFARGREPLLACPTT
jgi:3',5'-cyclic AMP phosphodiesterase CpdA